MFNDTKLVNGTVCLNCLRRKDVGSHYWDYYLYQEAFGLKRQCCAPLIAYFVGIKNTLTKL